jgi:hypothetical protein
MFPDLQATSQGGNKTQRRMASVSRQARIYQRPMRVQEEALERRSEACYLLRSTAGLVTESATSHYSLLATIFRSMP